MRPAIQGPRRAEILASDLQLLGDVGYDRSSLDVVARRAHVSQATLYRHRGRKVQPVGEAIDRWLEGRPGPADTGSLREDLMGALVGPGGLADAGSLSSTAGLLTAPCVDLDVAEVVRRRVLAANRDDVRAILERGLVRGDNVNRWALDLGALVDLVEPVLVGFALHRALLVGTPRAGRTSGP